MQDTKSSDACPQSWHAEDEVLWWAAYKVAIRPPGSGSAKDEAHLPQGLLVQLLHGWWREGVPHG